MDGVTIIVPGSPVPKGRPRMTKSGHAYTPRKTRQYEDDLRLLARGEMKDRKPFEGPVILHFDAYLQIPKSWPQWKKGTPVSHTAKPDFDNLLKIVDGLNGIVWVDDAQITRVTFAKYYSDYPRIEVTATNYPGMVCSQTSHKPEKEDPVE